MPDAFAYLVFAPDGEWPPQRVCLNSFEATELARRYMAETGDDSWNVYPLVLGEAVVVRREE